MKRSTAINMPNVWLGATAQNQATADERIPCLLDTPAAVRFVSFDPLLGNVDMVNSKRDYLGPLGRSNGPVIQRGIDWVICGGESGPGARPMHPDWVRSLRDQCQAAGVPFFFRQWGEWWPIHETGIPRCDEEEELSPFTWVDLAGKTTNSGCEPDALMLRRSTKQAGRILDGRTWSEFPGGREL